jgi:AraC-like DNA-binding protein
VVFLGRFDGALHRRFHSRFLRQPCDVRPDNLFERLVPGPLLTTDEVVAVWQTVFKQWFDEHHVYPPALRAKQLLTERLREPWTTARLALEVGASRTPLVAQFEEAFGMRPREYLVRVRLREGLRRLRTPHADRAAAISSAGYVSPVKFAARLRRYTSYTPARIQRMSAADFEALLDERLPLHAA